MDFHRITALAVLYSFLTFQFLPLLFSNAVHMHNLTLLSRRLIIEI